jgi:hypothetical protein
MPSDDSLTPRHLVEKLDVLRVECMKCGRSGRYRVLRFAEQIGWDSKLTDWLYSLPAQEQPRPLRPVWRAVPGLAEGGVKGNPPSGGADGG